MASKDRRGKREPSPRRGEKKGEKDQTVLFDAKPQEVRFTAYIRGLSDIDTLTQSFGLDVWMAAWTSGLNDSSTNAFQLSYENSDAVFDDRFHKDENRTMRPMWHIALQNAKDVEYCYRKKGMPTVRAFDDKRWFERQHVHCRVVDNMDLESFPFDTQRLKLTISLDVSTKVAHFVPGPADQSFIEIVKDPGSDKLLDETEWHSACSIRGSNGDYKFKSVAFGEINSLDPDYQCTRGDQYSRITLTIPVQRNPTSYIFISCLPLLLITIVALFSFAFNKGNDEVEKLNFAATLILAVFGFKGSASEKLPKTRNPCFLMCTYIMGYSFILAVMAVEPVCKYLAHFGFGEHVHLAKFATFCSYFVGLTFIAHRYYALSTQRRRDPFFQRLCNVDTLWYKKGQAISIHDAEPLLDADGAHTCQGTGNNKVFFYRPCWGFRWWFYHGLRVLFLPLCGPVPLVGPFLCLMYAFLGLFIYYLYVVWAAEQARTSVDAIMSIRTMDLLRSIYLRIKGINALI